MAQRWPASRHPRPTGEPADRRDQAAEPENPAEQEGQIMNDAQMTLVGNLVDDPELRFTPAGQPVSKFRVASTPRYLDKSTNEWKDGDSLFLTCNVWRQAGPSRRPGRVGSGPRSVGVRQRRQLLR